MLTTGGVTKKSNTKCYISIIIILIEHFLLLFFANEKHLYSSAMSAKLKDVSEI